MIRSMTAFARAGLRAEWGELVWELRSVNHRYLEIPPRLPDEFRTLEPRVREMMGARLGRGQASLRSRERFWDIRVPKIDSIFDNSLVPRPSWSPGVPPQHRKLVAATHRSPI